MSTFFMPVRVFEETDAVLNHAADLGALGRCALLVTGKHSAARNGSLSDVTQALSGTGTSYVLFQEVEENPSIETVMKGRDLAVESGADFVIGIGGGSALDAAKAIALMAKKADRDISYLYSPDGDSAALPIAAIPTTCGTGSEVTAVSVLTNTPKQIKKSIPHKLFPALALIDGKYLRSAPFSVLANTAFDALTHLIESELNAKSSPYSHMCAQAGLRTWAQSLPVLKKEKEPGDEDLMRMMRASAFAGMAIAHTGTTLPHGLSYPLTFRLGVPHGKATAYFTAGYLAEAPGNTGEALLKEAGFASVAEFDLVYKKACGTLDVPQAKLNEVLEAAVDEIMGTPAKLALAPFPVDEAMLRRIAFYSSLASVMQQNV